MIDFFRGTQRSPNVLRQLIYFFVLVFCFGRAVCASDLAEEGNPDYEAGLRAIQKEDYQTALKKWKPLAEEGNSDAQFALGYMYLQGKGVVMDYKKAMKWFRLAAEQGDSDAQNNLGLMYAVGNGVVEDRVYARMWFEIAASNGSEGAKKNLEASSNTISKADLEEAQNLAKDCAKKRYKEC